jgi:hypothetical protein
MRGQGGGELRGLSYAMIIAVHTWSPNKLWWIDSMFNLWCNRTWLRACTSWTWPSWRTCSTIIPPWTSRTSTGTILRTWRRQGKRKVRIVLFVYLQTCPLISLRVFLHPFVCKVPYLPRIATYSTVVCLKGTKMKCEIIFYFYILCIMLFLNFAQIRRSTLRELEY